MLGPSPGTGISIRNLRGAREGSYGIPRGRERGHGWREKELLTSDLPREQIGSLKTGGS